uniref:WD_REPEATS_REGION domain-containing protein n=1 Tax=Caenorhabditis tropicalis TaxID=1561998 RepID=A0A1I7T4J7_9PELO
MEDSGQLPNAQNDKTEEETSRSQYTMSGILHFIQHEWTKNELDRTRWEAERAEMQARIVFLQGERKGQENLKQDLVRRIKMLEFCLKQERAKNYRLTHNGEEPPSLEESPNENSAPSENSHLSADLDAYINDAGEAGGSFRQGRLLLKRYLEEIGYSEHIMDVRSFRVKNLLGLLPQTDLPSSERLNGRKEKSESDSDDGHDDAALDADASKAFEEFDFLNSMDVKDKHSETDDWPGKGHTLDKLIKQYKDDPKVKRRSRTSTEESDEKMNSDVHRNLETDIPPGIQSAIHASAQQELPTRRQGRRSANYAYGNGNELDVALGMQENDNMDIKDEFKEDDDDINSQPVKWNIKVTLRSHLDSIYAMQFHPVEPVLFTASEDGLIKLWNLEQKKEDKHNSGGGTELEPVYTFRGHNGPVLCLVLSPTGDHLYTGGKDGNICCFNVPSSNGDPFDPYDPRVLSETLTGHTDAIWSIAYHSSNSRLVSASSDSTIRLWEPGNGEPLIRTIGAPRPNMMPTSVDFVSTETSHLLAAYTQCYAQIIDIDTGSTVMVFDFGEVTGSPTMNKIVSHPTMPLTLVGGEDRTIRYFDNTTGSCIHESVAHVEGVSSLAIDPNGLYLLSGSHDGSIRMWNMEKRACLQEISAHRKKNDAAVTSVAFHPSRSLIGSAGADSLAKVYVSRSN